METTIQRPSTINHGFTNNSFTARIWNSQVFRMTRYSRFLLRSLFNTFVRPPLFVYLSHKIGLSVLPKDAFPSFLVYLASIPIAEVISSVLSSRRKRRDCERLGAVRIPKIKGKKLGNYDILQELIAAEDEDYPGDIFLRWAAEYGPTFDMNILWASQIVTGM
jgi:hypothetical protein